MHAEHMSQGSLSANPGFYATGKTIEVLEKMAKHYRTFYAA